MKNNSTTNDATTTTQANRVSLDERHLSEGISNVNGQENGLRNKRQQQLTT